MKLSPTELGGGILISFIRPSAEQGFDSPQLGLQCGDFSLEASHLGSKSFAVGTGLLRDAPTLPVSASQVPLLSSYDQSSFYVKFYHLNLLFT